MSYAMYRMPLDGGRASPDGAVCQLHRTRSGKQAYAIEAPGQTHGDELAGSLQGTEVNRPFIDNDIERNLGNGRETPKTMLTEVTAGADVVQGGFRATPYASGTTSLESHGRPVA